MTKPKKLNKKKLSDPHKILEDFMKTPEFLEFFLEEKVERLTESQKDKLYHLIEPFYYLVEDRMENENLYHNTSIRYTIEAGYHVDEYDTSEYYDELEAQLDKLSRLINVLAS